MERSEIDASAGQGDAAREGAFSDALENVTFTGHWTGINDGELGTVREESYTIVGATKMDGDRWLIRTKVRRGDRDIVVPVPVDVKWAGDTPLIIVQDLVMPGGETAYSARVLVHDGAYAGRWSGGSRGGLLSGIIVKNEEPQ